jgi:hypothetical protein
MTDEALRSGGRLNLRNAVDRWIAAALLVPLAHVVVVLRSAYESTKAKAFASDIGESSPTDRLLGSDIAGARERALRFWVFYGLAVAVLLSALSFPVHPSNRFATRRLWWTYRIADWVRAPSEPWPGYVCTKDRDGCSCTSTKTPGAEGTCGAQACCYRARNFNTRTDRTTTPTCAFASRPSPRQDAASRAAPCTAGGPSGARDPAPLER